MGLRYLRILNEKQTQGGFCYAAKSIESSVPPYLAYISRFLVFGTGIAELDREHTGGNNKADMDISYISSVYDVRKLSEEDIEDIYQLAVENPMYYQYCPPFVTRETILKDMKALPAGKNYEDKYYIGFWDKEKLAAVMDLLLDYPDKNTAFVGFFMMNRSLQGKGVGSAIIEEFCSCMKNQKYTYIRLGYVKDNPQSRRFWMKNHFEKTGIEYSDARYEIVVLQRLL